MKGATFSAKSAGLALPIWASSRWIWRISGLGRFPLRLGTATGRRGDVTGFAWRRSVRGHPQTAPTPSRRGGDKSHQPFALVGVASGANWRPAHRSSRERARDEPPTRAASSGFHRESAVVELCDGSRSAVGVCASGRNYCVLSVRLGSTWRRFQRKLGGFL